MIGIARILQSASTAVATDDLLIRVPAEAWRLAVLTVFFLGEDLETYFTKWNENLYKQLIKCLFFEVFRAGISELSFNGLPFILKYMVGKIILCSFDLPVENSSDEKTTNPRDVFNLPSQPDLSKEENICPELLGCNEPIASALRSLQHEYNHYNGFSQLKTIVVEGEVLAEVIHSLFSMAKVITNLKDPHFLQNKNILDYYLRRNVNCFDFQTATLKDSFIFTFAHRGFHQQNNDIDILHDIYVSHLRKIFTDFIIYEKDEKGTRRKVGGKNKKNLPKNFIMRCGAIVEDDLEIDVAKGVGYGAICNKYGQRSFVPGKGEDMDSSEPPVNPPHFEFTPSETLDRRSYTITPEEEEEIIDGIRSIFIRRPGDHPSIIK